MIKLDAVTSAAPRLTEESRLTSLVRSSGTSFSLLCRAQAYPLPRFK